MTYPRELTELPQWVLWRQEMVHGRPTKVPYSADGGGRASSTDPATWSSHERACAAMCAADYDGQGFVVTAADNIVGGDLDGCRNPDTGEIHPVAMTIVRRFNTYTEKSPSRRGLRFFGFAPGLPADHPCRKGKIEVYSQARYLTVTGEHLAGTPRTLGNVTDALHWLFETYFMTRPVPVRPRANQQCVPHDDHELIQRALEARNGHRFAQLWSGDWQAAGYNSQSEADLGLLSHLAYWCNGDATRMARLFEQSGLCRPKWIARGDYRTRTLARALAGVGHA